MENTIEKINTGFPEEMEQKINQLSERLDKLIELKNPKVFSEIAEFANKLRNRDPENDKAFYQYATYYILEREEPAKGSPPQFFDFPEKENSVEKFIERLEKEYH